MITTVIIGFIWYQIIAHIGISAGLHRYWSHKAFGASVVFEIITLYMAIIAGARSPIGWVSAHRMHHHHSDTKNDPHSPKYKGFWRVFFSTWSIQDIPVKYSKDLFENPRMRFFHKYWKAIWIISAITASLAGLHVVIAAIVIPAVLSAIGFGSVNAICHKNGNSRNVPIVNILVAGEGYHDEHHHGKMVRYHRNDTTGIIVEQFIKWGIFTK
jgi:stearoyl-CoA desaturase (delta-9 desaturase)